MGAVTNFIEDTVDFVSDVGEALVDAAQDIGEAIVDAGSDFLTFIWEEVFVAPIEKIFALFGYTGETVYSTEVFSKKLLDRDVDDNLTLAIVRAIRADEDIVPHIQYVLTTNIVNSLNLYISQGKENYIHGLPTVLGGFQQLNNEAIDDAITDYEGGEITILTAFREIPPDEHQVKWYLQENENYTENNSQLFKPPDPIPWFYDGFHLDINDDFIVDLQRTINAVGIQSAVSIDTGSHDGLANAAVLTDTSKVWIVNNFIGDLLVNNTDGSSGIITANTINTITAVLSGGTEDDWDITDSYSIFKNNAAILTDLTETWVVNEWLGETIQNTTDGSVGIVLSNTATTVTATLLGGTDNDWDIGDGYILSRDEISTLDYAIPAIEFGMYYVVTYELDVDPTYTKYWMYEFDEGTYPELDRGYSGTGDSVETVFRGAEMVPIVPVRKNFTNIDSDKESPEYLSCKKQLKILNLDFDDISNQVSENPSIDQIEDVFILFALNVYTESQAGKKALYTLFMQLWTTSEVSQADFQQSLIDNPASPEMNTARIDEQNYNVILKYDYISSTRINGVIGEVGTFDSEIVVLPNKPNDRFPPEGEEPTYGGINSYILLKYQYSTTHYNQFRIQGPALFIGILTTAGELRNNNVELSDDAAARENFNLPLPGSLVQSRVLNNFERDQIIQESLIMVIYASDSVWLEWYETPGFLRFLSVILTIVAIIVIFWDWSGSTSAALWALAQAILYQYAISLILKELLIAYGDSDRAKALIIAAYIAASFYGPGGGSGLDWAEALLFAVTAALNAITIDLQLQGEELQREVDAFLVDAEEREDELDAAKDLLDNNTGLNIWELATYTPIDPYEKPSSFYTRTVHTGNPGVLSLAQIESFVDNQLELPELDNYSFQPESVYT